MFSMMVSFFNKLWFQIQVRYTTLPEEKRLRYLHIVENEMQIVNSSEECLDKSICQLEKCIKAFEDRKLFFEEKVYFLKEKLLELEASQEQDISVSSIATIDDANSDHVLESSLDNRDIEFLKNDESPVKLPSSEFQIENSLESNVITDSIEVDLESTEQDNELDIELDNLDKDLIDNTKEEPEIDLTSVVINRNECEEKAQNMHFRIQKEIQSEALIRCLNALEINTTSVREGELSIGEGNIISAPRKTTIRERTLRIYLQNTLKQVAGILDLLAINIRHCQERLECLQKKKCLLRQIYCEDLQKLQISLKNDASNHL